MRWMTELGIAPWMLVGAVLACAAPTRAFEEAPATASLPPAAALVSAQEADMVPPGFGTLRQDDVSLALRNGNLLIKATPLDEAVIRLTAPDTYARLAGLADAHRETLERDARVQEPTLFLVSVFSYEPDVTYQPEDVNVVSQGIRERPLAIRAVTAGWGTQRLGQQETQMAVYAFSPGIDLELDLEVEYRETRNAGWERILSVIHAERAKVRARAGATAP